MGAGCEPCRFSCPSSYAADVDAARQAASNSVSPVQLAVERREKVLPAYPALLSSSTLDAGSYVVLYLEHIFRFMVFTDYRKQIKIEISVQ